MSQFQEILKDFLYTLFAGVLTVFAGFLIALAKKGADWVGTKIDQVKNETYQKNLNRLNSLLEATVYNVVVSLQQTIGDDIKNSIINNDGTYTREDLLNLKDTALSKIKEILTSQNVLDELTDIHKDLTSYIEDLIEVNVYQLKNQMVVGEIAEVIEK